MHQNLDLRFGQRAAILFREGGHQRFVPSTRDDAFEFRFRYDLPEQGIIERRRRAQLAVGTMTSGAVLPVEEGEIYNLVGGDRPVGRVRSAGKIASRAQER